MAEKIQRMKFKVEGIVHSFLTESEKIDEAASRTVLEIERRVNQIGDIRIHLDIQEEGKE